MLASAVVAANARRKKNSKHCSSANSDESHSSSYSTEQQQQQMKPISHEAAVCDESMIGEAKKRLDQRLQSRPKSQTNRPTSDIEQISKMSEDKPRAIQQESEMVEIKVQNI